MPKMGVSFRHQAERLLASLTSWQSTSWVPKPVRRLQGAAAVLLVPMFGGPVLAVAPITPFWRVVLAAVVSCWGLVAATCLVRSAWEVARLWARDPITGLLHKRAFLGIGEERRRDQPKGTLAVMILDLNGFKTYNDTYGHSAGDDVIHKVADLLRTAVRESDLVARVGGDEFAVLLFGVTRTEALAVAERIREEVAASTGWQVTASVGLVWGPAKALPLGQWIEQADAAMYREKRSRPPGGGSTGDARMGARMTDVPGQRHSRGPQLSDDEQKPRFLLARRLCSRTGT